MDRSPIESRDHIRLQTQGSESHLSLPNAFLRLILELLALLAYGYWASRLPLGLLAFPAALGVPVLVAIIWGTFRVPGDASASGEARVPISGLVRLLIELALLFGAVWAIIASGLASFGFLYGLMVIVHYLASYRRVSWLLDN